MFAAKKLNFGVNEDSQIDFSCCPLDMFFGGDGFAL